jgi:hypothetical protein
MISPFARLEVNLFAITGSIWRSSGSNPTGAGNASSICSVAINRCPETLPLLLSAEGRPEQTTCQARCLALLARQRWFVGRQRRSMAAGH